jgi:hypothetical protein
LFQTLFFVTRNAMLGRKPGSVTQAFGLDGRVKPGHDGGGAIGPSLRELVLQLFAIMLRRELAYSSPAAERSPPPARGGIVIASRWV